MTVTAPDGVRLATTDFGGEGPALVLLHGLGADRGDLAPLATSLTGLRVITADLRGHGDSTTGPWSFAAAVADVHAVVEHYGLTDPFLGGHSLGGMVALQYALSGRPVAGVINIDGWGPGVATRFVGEDPVAVGDRLARLGAGDLPTRWSRVLSARTRQGREGTNRQVLGLLHGADVVAWHRDLVCPSLAFNATAPGSRLLGREMRRMQQAHREGLRRDLAALPSQVRVVEVAAGHFVHRSHQDLVAREIAAFCG